MTRDPITDSLRCLLEPICDALSMTRGDGECDILCFDPRNEGWELPGALKDSDTGVAAWQVHDVCVTPDGTLYAGENDVPTRSGYLWEVAI